MGAKHGIWCCGALHQWKVFLSRPGRTLTQASILSVITLLDPKWQALLWKLEVHLKTLFMPILGIIVIHLWKPYLCPLRHCGYQPHEIYCDLPSYHGKGHTLIFKFTR